MAKDKFYVSYGGAALNSSLSQVIGEVLKILAFIASRKTVCSHILLDLCQM